MRLTGILALLGAVLVCACLGLWPVEGSILGTSYSCGLPIISAVTHPVAADSVDQALTDDCRRSSTQRVVSGMCVGGILGVFGIVMLAVSNAARHRRAVGPQQPPPGWWTDGRAWYPPRPPGPFGPPPGTPPGP